jgi:hypothetical protein
MILSGKNSALHPGANLHPTFFRLAVQGLTFRQTIPSMDGEGTEGGAARRSSLRKRHVAPKMAVVDDATRKQVNHSCNTTYDRLQF